MLIVRNVLSPRIDKRTNTSSSDRYHPERIRISRMVVITTAVMYSGSPNICFAYNLRRTGQFVSVMSSIPSTMMMRKWW